MTVNAELVRCLESLSNGTLTKAESILLDDKLANDAAAREVYLKWMATEAALNRVCVNQHQRQPTLETEQVAVTTKPHSTSARFRRSLMLAASLAGVAMVSSLLTQKWFSGPASTVAQPSTVPGEATLARITSTLNCRWAEPTRGAGYGAELRAGDQLILQAGVAEVTFNSGVRILLEGPATLDLHDATEAVLVDGRLAATIPSSAQQPMLRVDRFTAFQPGSEFGLLATEVGGGEVHVFSGNVSATLTDEGGATLQTLDVGQFEGLRMAPAARTMTKFEAQGDQFVRSLSPTSGPHDGLYLQESFDYADGPLSLQNGGFGWAGPWEDIETAPNSEGEKTTNRVAATSLTTEGMVSSGGRAIQIAQRNRIRRSLSTSIGGVLESAGLVENRDGHRLVGRDGQTVYISFLQRIDRLDDIFYGFELNRGDGNGNRVLCIGNGAEGAGYGVTSNVNQYDADNYPSLGEENTETNLLVVRIDFGPDDRDTVTIYRNPRSLAEESDCMVNATLLGNFAFDRISLGNFDGAKIHEIDEIRVGTSYRAVVGQRDLFRKDLSRRFATNDVLMDARMGVAEKYRLLPIAVASFAR